MDSNIQTPAWGDSDRMLDEFASKALLREYGVVVPKAQLLAVDTAIDRDLGGLKPPLALKVIARGVLHKSDVGGVKLGLTDAQSVTEAIAEIQTDSRIPNAAISGYLLEEMAPPGHEMVIGGVVDRRFGPVVMVGLGGIFVEVLKDVAFRACPIEERDAVNMIASLKGAPILDGARGGIRADSTSLVDVLLRIGGANGLLMGYYHKLRELDINPLIVSTAGAIAVDARVILA